MKSALVLLSAGLLAGDILYTCSVLQDSCRRTDRHKGHTEAIVADVLGRLGELEAEVSELRAGRVITAEAGD